MENNTPNGGAEESRRSSLSDGDGGKGGKSCKGCLYYSSLRKSNNKKPICFGISRTLKHGLPLFSPPLYSIVLHIDLISRIIVSVVFKIVMFIVCHFLSIHTSIFRFFFFDFKGKNTNLAIL